jgi:D-amino-acid oxidase
MKKHLNDILHRCQQLETRLRGLEIFGAKVELRPGRSEIRLEIERTTNKCSVIHNYGYGGAGFTLSWGCAEDVLELAKGGSPPGNYLWSGS